jgi:hypothetical protein
MRLAILVKTALEETRMLVLGAQVLLGFEFSGVFRDGFERLPLHTRYLDGIALLLLIVTVALLITPETYHHIVEVGRDTGRFHQLISRRRITRYCHSRLVSALLSLSLAKAFSVSRPGWQPAILRPSRSRMLVRAPISAAAANRS